MSSYLAFKVVHILGVVLFLGNIIVTGVWKVLADNTGDPRTIAYAQNLVTLTDWIFTAGGVVLILIGAYGMVWVAGLNPLGPAWLIWGQSLFIASGIIWVAFLIPTQIAQARERAVSPTAVRSRKVIGVMEDAGRSGGRSPRCCLSPISISWWSSRPEARAGGQVPCRFGGASSLAGRRRVLSWSASFREVGR